MSTDERIASLEALQLFLHSNRWNLPKNRSHFLQARVSRASGQANVVRELPSRCGGIGRHEGSIFRSTKW